MKNTILLCWLGATDIRASSGVSEVGLGPIAQAVANENYTEVVLLNNWEQAKAESYILWLQQQSQSPITLKQIELSSPTNFGEIYQAACKVIAGKQEEHGINADFTYHLSPGTPAMAAVWILIAKTRFPARLIESSKDYGVRTASVPFDISADFIPDLLRRQDKTLERLAFGLSDESPEFDKIIHRSEAMTRAVLKARHVAHRSVPVLIQGESGTGKELFARAVHDASPRRDKPFITINCGAIPPELVESELFGYEKGAFTGASAQKTGYFEAADQGTIFLDEIGELPKNMQVKLLRVVQESEVKRVGSTQARKINIRIITATNRNLIDEVAAGRFREDLFYRLAVAVINIPPLRDRTGDISLLVDRFLEKINKESEEEPNYKHKKISPSARNLLLQHYWRGNVRELQNTLTRAAVWSVKEELSADDIKEALFQIPDYQGKSKDNILDRSLEKGVNLPEIIKTVALHYLERGLAETAGNKTKTAEILGLSSYQTLNNWLKRYGVE